MYAFLPPGHEERAVAFDDRGRDYDSRRHAQSLAIGHTRHRGLRATQMRAPKSISAWLKSNTSRVGTSVSDTAHKCRFIAWLLGSPLPTKTRKSTRATLVSRIAARSRNAKLRIAPAVYAPMPLNDRSVSSSDGSWPPYFATASRAIDCKRLGRMLYPSGYHVFVTSCSGACASASSDGYLPSHSAYFGSTRSTCVCCSMISETRMWYGSSVLRQGRSRPCRRYHVNNRWRNRRRSGGAGTAGVWGFEGISYNPTVTLYTRTGDGGETSYFDGTRVRKDDPRLETYGDIDELNSWIGFVRTSGLDAALDEELGRIQRELFALGAQVADPAEKIAPRVAKAAVTDADVARLETAIDRAEAEAPPLRHFVLPGGTQAAAALHVARTVCRRAERRMVALESGVDPVLLRYLNRLSDLLFALARVVNH